MAIKVNGTTVINDSRALTNIASVDAATATAIGAAGVGGATTVIASNASSGTGTTLTFSLANYKEQRFSFLFKANGNNLNNEPIVMRLGNASGTALTSKYGYIYQFGTSLLNAPNEGYVKVLPLGNLGSTSGHNVWHMDFRIWYARDSSRATCYSWNASGIANNGVWGQNIMGVGTMFVPYDNSNLTIFQNPNSTYNATFISGSTYSSWGIN